MVSFTSVFTAFSLVAGVFAAPAQIDAKLLAYRQNIRWAVQNWKNDYATVNFTNGPAGAFALKWNNGFGGDFVIGKGYQYSSSTGLPKINYTGSFHYNQGANAYLAMYGWTMNPLAEFYVIENMGVHNPSDNASATQYGVLESDGGTYEIWTKIRTNAPSILGDSDTYPQYWSVRTKTHTGGTINVANHFQAWKAVGFQLGNPLSFQIVVEGQYGGGNANITVGVSPTIFPPETATSTRRTETHHYSTHPLTTFKSTAFGVTSTTKPTTSTTSKPTTSTTSSKTSTSTSKTSTSTSKSTSTSTSKLSTITTTITKTSTSSKSTSTSTSKSTSKLSTITTTVTKTSTKPPPTSTKPSFTIPNFPSVTLAITIGAPP